MGTKAVSLVLVVLAVLGLSASTLGSGDGKGYQVPEGVYIELTRDFYQALKQEANTYTNDPSQEYLRRISVSARFMVETNLKILEQQERILRKLDEISNQLHKR